MFISVAVVFLLLLVHGFICALTGKWCAEVNMPVWLMHLCPMNNTIFLSDIVEISTWLMLLCPRHNVACPFFCWSILISLLWRFLPFVFTCMVLFCLLLYSLWIWGSFFTFYIHIFLLACTTFGYVSFPFILANLSIISFSLSSVCHLLPFIITFLRWSSVYMGVAVLCHLVLVIMCPVIVTLIL